MSEGAEGAGAGSTERLARLDTDPELRERLLPFCRLAPGEIWEDPERGHRVGVLDAAREEDVLRALGGRRPTLVLCDPPYNVRMGGGRSRGLATRDAGRYLEFSEAWISSAVEAMARDSSLYIWVGADFRRGFSPFPELMMLLRRFPELEARSWITLRNQRGYGTQKNWMWVRQELLFYTMGSPPFRVTYTDIPRVLRGYYKTVGGRRTENRERSRSATIRPGNVWVDIQQVFYRMEENVPGCYAQKPLAAIRRIVEASSREGDLVADFFAHSGTTLLAGEQAGRRVCTFDIDPVYAEITIRRLQRYRRTGCCGWQWNSPFPEIDGRRRE